MLFDCHISCSSGGHIFNSIDVFFRYKYYSGTDSMTGLKEAPMLQVVFGCMTVEKT